MTVIALMAEQIVTIANFDSRRDLILVLYKIKLSKLRELSDTEII